MFHVKHLDTGNSHFKQYVKYFPIVGDFMECRGGFGTRPYRKRQNLNSWCIKIRLVLSWIL